MVATTIVVVVVVEAIKARCTGCGGMIEAIMVMAVIVVWW